MNEQPLDLWYSHIGRHLIDEAACRFDAQLSCKSCAGTDKVFIPGRSGTPVCVRCYAMAKKHPMASKTGIKAGLDRPHAALISAQRIQLLADIELNADSVEVISSKRIRVETWLQQFILDPPSAPFLLIRFAAKPALVARNLRISYDIHRTYLCSDVVRVIDLPAVAHAFDLVTRDAIPLWAWKKTLQLHSAVQRETADRDGLQQWRKAYSGLLETYRQYPALKTLVPYDRQPPISHGSQDYDMLNLLLRQPAKG